jgi:hypothetical protein
MSAEEGQDTNLREMLAQRVHVPDVGLENAGDIVTFNNQESAVVTVKGKRLRLTITSQTTFELKHSE